MKVESGINPEKYKFEKLKKGRCIVYFFDNVEEKIITQEIETEKERKIYIYDMFEIEVFDRDNLQQDIEANYETWLNFAKQQEYDKLAKEVREKRNKLLTDTDKEMCLDRLGIDVPEGTTFSSWVSFLKSIGNMLTGEMAKYRQELRDITKQSEFPYNVKFPKNPIRKEE